MPENNFSTIKPVIGPQNNIPTDSVKRRKKQKQQQEKKDKEEEKEAPENMENKASESETKRGEESNYNDQQTNRLDFRA